MSVANVNSIPAVDDFRAALGTFAHESRQALSMIDMEVRRSLQWLCHDQPQYWQHEVRRWGEAVNSAKLELQRCRTFKAVGDYVPACTEEKKQLARAQERLRHSEIKFETTRRWARQIQHEVNEFEGRLSQLTSVLDGDLPRAIGTLERMLRALDTYVTTTAPAAVLETDGSSASGSMAQPIEDFKDSLAMTPGVESETEAGRTHTNPPDDAAESRPGSQP